MPDHMITNLHIFLLKNLAPVENQPPHVLANCSELLSNGVCHYVPTWRLLPSSAYRFT
jgi:hypothetical protein